MSNNALVPIEGGNSVQPLCVSLYGVYEGNSIGELSTFDPQTPEGAKLFLEATLGEPINIKEAANLDLDICHFYVNKVSKTNDEGEVDEWGRIVLFTEDGKAYSCGSRGVAKSLYVFSRMRPILPWHPPIRVKVKIRNLSNQKQWIVLDPDPKTLIPQMPSARPGKR